MRFFERLDLQVKQLYRSVRNLSKPRHLKFANQVSKRLSNEEIITRHLVFSSLTFSHLQIYGNNLVNMFWNYTHDLKTSVISSLLTSAIINSTIIETTYRGVGFYRGLKNSDKSLDVLEKLIQDPDISNRDFNKYADLLEKHQNKKYFSLIEPSILNKEYMWRSYNNLENLINDSFTKLNINNEELLKKVIANEKHISSIKEYICDVDELKGFSKRLLEDYLESNHKITSYDIKYLIKIKDNLENLNETKKEILLASKDNPNNRLYFLEAFTKAEIHEEHKEMYLLAAKKSYLNEMVYYDKIFKELDKTEFYDLLPNCIKRNIIAEDIMNIVKNKDGLLSNEYSKKLISEVMKISQRRSFSRSVDIISKLSHKDQDLLEDMINNYGKKWRKHIFSRLTPLFEIMNVEEITSIMREYKDSGKGINHMLNDDIFRRKIEEYFGGINIHPSITTNDITACLKGYQHTDFPEVNQKYNKLINS